MASNFPVIVDDAGNEIQIISGISTDFTGNQVKFNEGQKQLIAFLERAGFTTKA